MDDLYRLVHPLEKSHLDFFGLARHIRSEIEHLKRGLEKGHVDWGEFEMWKFGKERVSDVDRKGEEGSVEKDSESRRNSIDSVSAIVDGEGGRDHEGLSDDGKYRIFDNGFASSTNQEEQENSTSTSRMHEESRHDFHETHGWPTAKSRPEARLPIERYLEFFIDHHSHQYRSWTRALVELEQMKLQQEERNQNSVPSTKPDAPAEAETRATSSGKVAEQLKPSNMQQSSTITSQIEDFIKAEREADQEAELEDTKYEE